MDGPTAILSPRRTYRPEGVVTLVSPAQIRTWKEQHRKWITRCSPTPVVRLTAMRVTWNDLPLEMQREILERLCYEVNSWKSHLQCNFATFGLYFMSHTSKATRALVFSIARGVSALTPLAEMHPHTRPILHSHSQRLVTTMASVMPHMCCTAIASGNQAFVNYENKLHSHDFKKMHPDDLSDSCRYDKLFTADLLRAIGFSNSPSALVAELDHYGYIGGKGFLTDAFIETKKAAHVGDDLVCTGRNDEGFEVASVFITIFEGATMGGHDAWALEIWNYMRTINIADFDFFSIVAASGRVALLENMLNEASLLESRRQEVCEVAIAYNQVHVVRLLLDTPLSSDSVFKCIDRHLFEPIKTHAYGVLCKKAILKQLFEKLPLGEYSRFGRNPEVLRGIPVEFMDKIMEGGAYLKWDDDAHEILFALFTERKHVPYMAKIMDVMVTRPMIEDSRRIDSDLTSLSTVEAMSSAGAFERFPDLVYVYVATLFEQTKTMDSIYPVLRFLCEKHGARLAYTIPTRLQSWYRAPVKASSFFNEDFVERVRWAIKNGFEMAKHIPLSQFCDMIVHHHADPEKAALFGQLFADNVYPLSEYTWTTLFASLSYIHSFPLITQWFKDMHLPIDTDPLLQLALTGKYSRLLPFLNRELGIVPSAQILYKAIETKRDDYLIRNIMNGGCVFDVSVVESLLTVLDIDDAAAALTRLSNKKTRKHQGYMKKLREILRLYLLTLPRQIEQ